MHPTDAYLDGAYASKTGGTWHLEDSPYKAGQVLRMLQRHPEISPDSICDIGCGAGGVLAELARRPIGASRLVGYDVSPHANALSRALTNQRLEFRQDDPFQDGEKFDVALVLDVVEHVEDCFAFLRSCSTKARWKIYIVPLDTSASMVLRGANCWESVGHLHLFTKETALKSVEHSGQRVVDWFLTPTSLVRPHRFATRFTNIARRILPQALASRLLGGYSIMILAE
ncbi:MAG: class I SAM-dependent methyltransferase [Acidobacteriota bacterium]